MATIVQVVAEAACMRLVVQTILVSDGDRGVVQQHRLLAHARHSQTISNAVSVADVPMPGIPSPNIGFLGWLSAQVRFHGEQARDDAFRPTADCSGLVLPSRWENHPIALIEAMLLGLPVDAQSPLPATRRNAGWALASASLASMVRP